MSDLGAPVGGAPPERHAPTVPAAETASADPVERPLAPPRPRNLVGASLGRRDQLTRRLLVVADVAGLVVAALLAGALAGNRISNTELIWLTLPVMPLLIVLFKLYGLYDRDLKRISHSGLDDLPWLFHALVIGTLMLWLYVRLVVGDRMIFAETLIFGIAALVGTSIARSLARRSVIWLLGPERVLIAGEGAIPQLLIRKITHHPEYGLEAIALLVPSGRPTVQVAAAQGAEGLPEVGGPADLERVIRAREPERIVICRPDFSSSEVLEMIDACRRYSVKVAVVPGAVDAFGPSLQVDEVEGVTVLGVNPLILGWGSRALKRGFDLVIAVSMLLIASPLMLAIAIAIKLDAPGPVFFRQRRVGRDGREFTLIKFRTMCEDAERQREGLMSESRDERWLDLEDDPRIARFGGRLRRSSLDELPQLFNVLRGEMSMVGPRPLPAEEDAQVSGWARGRLDLTPGITGLWQVLGRTRIPFEEMVKLDYIYVTNWSLWGDLRLLLQTLPAVFARRGVN